MRERVSGETLVLCVMWRRSTTLRGECSYLTMPLLYSLPPLRFPQGKTMAQRIQIKKTQLRSRSRVTPSVLITRKTIFQSFVVPKESFHFSTHFNFTIKITNWRNIRSTFLKCHKMLVFLILLPLLMVHLEVISTIHSYRLFSQSTLTSLFLLQQILDSITFYV